MEYRKNVAITKNRSIITWEEVNGLVTIKVIEAFPQCNIHEQGTPGQPIN